MTSENPSLAFAATISYFLTAIFNSILVVLKETNEGVEDFLKDTFGHHWIGHGIIVLLVFVILTIIFNYAYKVDEIDESRANMMIWLIILGTIISVLIIFGYNASVAL